MRRIFDRLHARAKKADMVMKRGGIGSGFQPVEDVKNVRFAAPDDLLLLDETLAELTKKDPVSGKLVELRYFAGLSMEQAAEVMGISTATGYRHWSFARAWLHSRIKRRRPEREK